MIKLNLQLHASEKITGKIERKYMAHLLNTAIGEETPNWVRLGKDLEELNIELNPDTETKEDVTGARQKFLKCICGKAMQQLDLLLGRKTVM